MRGNDEIIEILNEVLTAELTAVNQYFVHARGKAFIVWLRGVCIVNHPDFTPSCTYSEATIRQDSQSTRFQLYVFRNGKRS